MNATMSESNEEEGEEEKDDPTQHCKTENDQVTPCLSSSSADAPHQQQQQLSPTQRRRNDWTWTILLHLLGCCVYLLPLTTHPYQSNHPVLDELHVCSADNVDVNGPLPFSQILQHDYWGRPMTAENSHKSWRPLTILSFRYLGGGGGRPASNNHPLTTYAHGWITTLTLHRLVNVLLHAATADLVAILATRLFLNHSKISSSSSFVLYALTKLVFLLHPTHVEVTANAANRNHLLATMFSLLLILSMPCCSPPTTTTTRRKRSLALFTLFLTLVEMPLLLLLGFASSETFLFQIPAIMVTATVLEFVQLQQQQQQDLEQRKRQSSLSMTTTTTTTCSSSNLSLFLQALYHLRLRHLIVVFGALFYAFGRYYFDTLSIPQGLLRPAENPFVHYTGWKRLWNYMYVTALHVMKSLGLDVIGFSHEYGERCIEPLQLQPLYVGEEVLLLWGDVPLLLPVDGRFLLPLGLVVVLGTVTYYTVSMALPKSIPTTDMGTNGCNDINTTDEVKGNHFNSDESQRRDHTGNLKTTDGDVVPLLLWLMHLSWLFTLFPITGIVKVGTFVSDRIVVPSTVSVCILLGAAMTKLLLLASTVSSKRQRSYFPTRLIITPILVLLLLGYMWRRIHIRSLQWMDSVPLLESSLKTCPNFAKGHLEISKVYSGLYPALFNLTKSRWHLLQVERIDATYCDVHQQFSHVALQELNYVEFEERLVQAMLCPFTMGGAVEMWKRYWQAVLGPKTPEAQRVEAQVRQQKYTEQIQKAVAEQEKVEN